MQKFRKNPKNSAQKFQNCNILEYYINEILCEDDCIKESYENETQRIVCKCPMKTEPKYINKTNLTPESFHEINILEYFQFKSKIN